MRRRDDDAFFGFAAGAHSAKPVLFPADELLWRGRRTREAFKVEPEPDRVGIARTAGHGPYARSACAPATCTRSPSMTGCSPDGSRPDARYLARREGAFIVSVSCTDPGGTCFCVSMGTGPRPEGGPHAGFDLSLTELLDGVHRFVVEVGSVRGAELLADISAPPAPIEDLAAADAAASSAAGRMGRTMDTDGCLPAAVP